MIQPNPTGIMTTEVQRQQARRQGVGGVVRISPLIHTEQREALLHTRIHILRHVMQVCRDQDDLSRLRLCKPCLPSLQLAEGMQFTDKALTAGPQYARSLLKKHVQVGDVFEDEETDHEIDRCRSEWPGVLEITLHQSYLGCCDPGTGLRQHAG